VGERGGAFHLESRPEEGKSARVFRSGTVLWIGPPTCASPDLDQQRARSPISSANSPMTIFPMTFCLSGDSRWRGRDSRFATFAADDAIAINRHGDRATALSSDPHRFKSGGNASRIILTPLSPLSLFSPHRCSDPLATLLSRTSPLPATRSASTVRASDARARRHGYDGNSSLSRVEQNCAQPVNDWLPERQFESTYLLYVVRRSIEATIAATARYLRTSAR